MKTTIHIAIALILINFTSFAQSKDLPAITSGSVKTQGITLAYEIIGAQNKETIILIGGTGAQLTAWPIDLCNKLASSGYRVIRFDNRDAGLSSKLDSLGIPDWASIIPKIKTCDTSVLQYTIHQMARDVKGLIDELNIQKAHIVGASMGGAIAQLFTIMFPERTLSLTCIAASSGNPELPPGDPQVLATMATPPPSGTSEKDRATYLFNIYKAMDSRQHPTPDDVLKELALKNVRRSWYPEGASRHAAAIIIADNCDRRKVLNQISVPVVIIHGNDDPVVPVQAANEIAAAINGSRLIIIPGMGHALSPAFQNKIAEGILTAAKSK